MLNHISHNCSSFAYEKNGLYHINRPVTPEEIFTMAKEIISKSFLRDIHFDSTRVTSNYFMMKLAQYEHEIFCIAFLDNQHRVIACEEMFRGTINNAVIYPRELVKRALHYNAAALILAHNHPSGFAEPSQEDKDLTGQLKEILALMDIKILDHIVIGGTEAISFADRGLLQPWISE